MYTNIHSHFPTDQYMPESMTNEPTNEKEGTKAAKQDTSLDQPDRVTQPGDHEQEHIEIDEEAGEENEDIMSTSTASRGEDSTGSGDAEMEKINSQTFEKDLTGEEIGYT